MADRDTPEFLTVPELAALLRVKERKVYDLAASGGVPCSRVTGKLLFPEAEVRAWIAAGRSGGATPAPGPRPPLFLGSHDPLLEWALRQSRCGLATFLDGSLDGLARFRAREGVATGLHLRDPDGGWNRGAVDEHCGSEDAVLVSWAIRRRGLVIRAEDAGAIRAPADLRGRRVVPRQAESGSQRLLDAMLAEAGLPEAAITRTETARSEQDAVMAVAQGAADAALGLEALARPFGLEFLPVVDEHFDLLVDRRAWFEPPMQALLHFTASAAFRDHAAGLAGYDIAMLGEVRRNL